MDLRTCRLCGENAAISYIFNKEFLVSDKIMYCTKLSVVEGDGLPTHICRNCEDELSSTHRFILKCETTDRRLRAGVATGVLANSAGPGGDLKPKVEVKIEVQCAGELDAHCGDSRDDCGSFVQKEEINVGSERPEIKTKKPTKYKTKYAQSSQYKCSVCGRESVSPSALVAHMRRHSGESPFPCASCDKTYKNRGSLKRHTDRHHFAGERQRNFMCENCGKKFFSKNDVKIHMRTHTGETPYACGECARRFSQAGALRRHALRHAGRKPHACARCLKRFCTKEGLSHHLRVHSDEKNYSCSICRVPFKYRNNLKKHMVIHSAPNSFVCNYCGRTFNQKGNLKSHIDRQHSAKSGYCDVCSKNVPDIEVHMWRHTGQRPLKCEFCTSCFFDMKSLGRHVNYRHKNIDKFGCSYEGCGMKFPARSMLEFHVAKLHDTRIPFPCDRCTRGFYRKNDLARHKIGTHKERLIVV